MRAEDPVRRTCSTLGLASLLLLVTLVTLRSCGADDEPQWRPSVVWDGDAYIATWSIYEGDSTSAVFIQRINETSSHRAVRPIFKGPSVRSGPDIAHSGQRAIVVFGQGDTPGDEDWHPRRHLVIVPLDRTGNVTGESQTTPWAVSPDTLCTAPAWTGRHFVVGYGEYSRHHRHRDKMGVIFITESGAYRGHILLRGRSSECALAVQGEVLAVAAGRQASDELGSPYNIDVQFIDTTTAGLLPDVVTIHSVNSGSPWSWVVLVPYNNAWALLYMDADKTSRVALLDRNGIIDTIALPVDVEPATAHLGVNDRGLFVTWRRDGKVHLRGLEPGPAHTVRAPRSSEGTYAVGHADECAAVWNSHHGKRIHLARARCQ